MDHVSLFDVISIGLILILGIAGVIKGFVKEVFGLVGVIGGIYFSLRYGSQAGALINEHLVKLGNQSVIDLVGLVAVLVLFWIGAVFIGHLVSHALDVSGLGIFNRLAGFLVGCLKIFLVFSIFIVLLNRIEFIKQRLEPYTKNSIMYPIFFEAGSYIVKLDHKQLINNITPSSPAAEKTNP